MCQTTQLRTVLGKTIQFAVLLSFHESKGIIFYHNCSNRSISRHTNNLSSYYHVLISFSIQENGALTLKYAIFPKTPKIVLCSSVRKPQCEHFFLRRVSRFSFIGQYEILYMSVNNQNDTFSFRYFIHRTAGTLDYVSLLYITKNCTMITSIWQEM